MRRIGLHFSRRKSESHASNDWKDVKSTREKTISGSDRTTIFERMYGETASRLYAYLTRTIADPATRDDVFQETWMAVFKRRLTEMPDKPLAYVLTVAGRLSRRRHRRVTLSTNDVAPRADVPRHDLRRELERAIDALPCHERSVFLLRHRFGLDYAEIARVCDIAPGTVGSRLHSAVGRLRRVLRDLAPMRSES